MEKRKKDILVVAVILSLVLAGFAINFLIFRDQAEVYGEIYVDGELIQQVDLSKDQEFSIAEQPQIVFEVKNHSITFIESDCPDKICIHAGFIGHNGQSATCLPNKTTIRIRSKKTAVDEPDIVAYRNCFDIYGGVL